MFLSEVQEAAAGTNLSSTARPLTELQDSQNERWGSETDPTVPDSRAPSSSTGHPKTGCVEKLMGQDPEGQRSLGLAGQAPPDHREGNC